LSWDIVDPMLTVKELMLSPDGTDAEPLDELAEPDEVAEVDELDEPDELHAAAVSARTAARPARPARQKERELQAPADLLPTLNPHIPSL
jgi:hypothetical protein